MEDIILSKATDEQLENIIRKAENTHVGGSQFERASIELDIRRKRRLFEQQEKIISTLQSKLDNIIHVLSLINKKPLLAVIIAGSGAISVGVLVNVFSELLLKLFRLK